MKVFTNYDWAGEIGRSGIKTQFTYQPACKSEHALSLLMPMRPEPYMSETYDSIHPIFDMNMPEGFLLEKLRAMFSKVIPVVDKITMLELVGRSQIGRVRVAASVEEIKEVPARSLKELLTSRGTDELFADLLKSYARYSGIAGVQPKVLARDSGTLKTMRHAGLFSPSTITRGEKVPARFTAPGTTHIVKLCDQRRFPALVTNEFLCLKAAKKAGLPVPAMWLGDNRRSLVVERFDTKPDGTYLAFEDVCALRLMQSSQKYMGSCEDAAHALSRHITQSHFAQDMRIFFESVVLSVCVRNGDAHFKNFGVLYENAGDVRIAPTYDIVSTRVYQKNDVLALALGGSQMWPTSKRLLRFGASWCGLTRQEAQDSMAKVVEAVESVRPEIQAHAKDSTTEAEKKALKNMDEAWRTGVASLALKAQ